MDVRIAKSVAEVLERDDLSDLTSVVMVGGYSGSIHLQASCPPEIKGPEEL